MRHGGSPILAGRAASTRAHLLSVASDIVERDGAATVTTTLLAVRARVSVGTVYRYFESAEDVLDDLRALNASAMRAALDEAFKSTTTSLEALVSRVVDAFVACCVTCPTMRDVGIQLRTPRQGADCRWMAIARAPGVAISRATRLTEEDATQVAGSLLAMVDAMMAVSPLCADDRARRLQTNTLTAAGVAILTTLLDGHASR